MSVTVWVVDDDPDVAVHLELVLNRAGQAGRVQLFETAAAVDAAVADPDDGTEPNLILVDQVLPDARGADLLSRLHRAHPRAVIRLITAAPDEVDAVDRAVGVVEKPPTVQVLRALLELGR